MGDDDVIPTRDRIIMALDAGDASVEPTTHLVGRLTRQDFTCKLFLDIIPRRLVWIDQDMVVTNS